MTPSFDDILNDLGRPLTQNEKKAVALVKRLVLEVASKWEEEVAVLKTERERLNKEAEIIGMKIFAIQLQDAEEARRR